MVHSSNQGRQFGGIEENNFKREKQGAGDLVRHQSNWISAFLKTKQRVSSALFTVSKNLPVYD